MSYPLLKHLHMTLAIVSVCSFALRWWWMKTASILLEYRLTRVLPHIVDTLLLASGIWLALTVRQYPVTHGWLSAKMLGLVAYIILGSLALKRAKTQKGRTLALISALLTFAWMVSVAVSKDPWGVFSLLS